MSKRNKRPRLKRSHLKKWSSAAINTGPTRNREVISQYADTAKGLGIHLCLCGLDFINADKLKEHLARWPGSKEHCFVAQRPDPPRVSVARQLWQSNMKQGLDKFNSFPVCTTKEYNESIFFSGQKCFFIKANKFTAVTEQSAEYNYGVDFALNWHRLGKVKYIKTITPESSEQEGLGPKLNLVSVK